MSLSDSAVSPRRTRRASDDTTVVGTAQQFSDSSSSQVDDKLVFDSAFDTATMNSWKDVEPWLTRCEEADGIGRLNGFLLQSLLGRGGMGVVFLALDESLNRQVAIKVLAPSLLADSIARDRFRREAQAAAAVKHSGIVTIFQVVDDGQLPYIVMEYVQGHSLSQVLTDSQMSLDDVARISVRIASALSAAHEKGLIHRDIKPANILLETDSGNPRITDFGLVRGNNDVTLTGTGALIGTPAYMAPEVIAEDETDARMDLFSLGATLYHMVVGRVPFEGRSALATLHRISSGQYTPVTDARADCPPDLARLIEKLLSARPEDRYPNSDAVVEALHDCDWTGTLSDHSPHRRGQAATASSPRRSQGKAAANARSGSHSSPRSAAVPWRRRLYLSLIAAIPLAMLATAAGWHFWTTDNSFVCRDEDRQLIAVSAETLAEAISATPDGGYVELSGYGDVYIDSTIVLEKSVELVGTGDHPARVLAADELRGPLFEVLAPSNFVNLHLEDRRRRDLEADDVSLVQVSSGGCVIRQSTLMLESGSTVVVDAAESLELIDCKVSNIRGIAIDWFPGEGDVELIISDTKLVARTALQLDQAFSGSCQIVDCRVLAVEAIRWLQEDEIGRQFAPGEFLLDACTIIATEAVFVCDWAQVPAPTQAAPLHQVRLLANRLVTPAIIQTITKEGARNWRATGELDELNIDCLDTSVISVAPIEELVGRPVDEAISNINREPELSDKLLEAAADDG